MNITGKKVGYCLTGSFCTFSKSIEQIKKIIDAGAEVVPIMSYNSYNLNTKFGDALEHIKKIEDITSKKIIHTIQDAEPIGPQHLTDIMIIAPCSWNTIAKLANGITDTPVLMASKSHLRNSNPLIIAISTNDGLSGSAESIGKLLKIIVKNKK